MAFDYRKLIEKHESEIVGAIQLAIVAASVGSLVKPDKTAKKLKKVEYKEISKQKKLASKLKIKEKNAAAKSRKKADLAKDKAKLKKLKLKNKLEIEKKKAELKAARKNGIVYAVLNKLNL